MLETLYEINYWSIASQQELAALPPGPIYTELPIKERLLELQVLCGRYTNNVRR